MKPILAHRIGTCQTGFANYYGMLARVDEDIGPGFLPRHRPDAKREGKYQFVHIPCTVINEAPDHLDLSGYHRENGEDLFVEGGGLMPVNARVKENKGGSPDGGTPRGASLIRLAFRRHRGRACQALWIQLGISTYFDINRPALIDLAALDDGPEGLRKVSMGGQRVTTRWLTDSHSRTGIIRHPLFLFSTQPPVNAQSFIRGKVSENFQAVCDRMRSEIRERKRNTEGTCRQSNQIPGL